MTKNSEQSNSTTQKVIPPYSIQTLKGLYDEAVSEQITMNSKGKPVVNTLVNDDKLQKCYDYMNTYFFQSYEDNYYCTTKRSLIHLMYTQFKQ